jgi:hypothetical protein
MDARKVQHLIGRQVLVEMASGARGNATLKAIIPHCLDQTKWIAVFGNAKDWYVEGAEITSIFAVTN